MLIKIKLEDRTVEFDSSKVPVAILLTPKDKEAIEKMPAEQQMIVSFPLQAMNNGNAAELWQWAYEDWQGATMVTPQSVPLVGSDNVKRN